MSAGRIRRLTVRHPIRLTLPNNRSPKRLNPEQKSTYETGRDCSNEWGHLSMNDGSRSRTRLSTESTVMKSLFFLYEGSSIGYLKGKIESAQSGSVYCLFPLVVKGARPEFSRLIAETKSSLAPLTRKITPTPFILRLLLDGGIRF